MITAFRYRLFRIGRFPAQLAAAAARDDALAAADGISIRSRRAGLKLPGQNRRSGYRLLAGALVLTSNAVQLAIGSWVLPTSQLTETTEADSPARIRVDGDGVHIEVEVARLVRAGGGDADLHYRFEIQAAVLDRLAGRFGNLHLSAAEAQVLSRRL